MDWKEQLLNRGYPEDDIKVYAECELTCAYCGADGRDCYFVFRHLVLDHVVPKALFPSGQNVNKDNRVVSCVRCNSLKGAWLPDGKLEALLLLDNAQDRAEELKTEMMDRIDKEKSDWEAFKKGISSNEK